MTDIFERASRLKLCFDSKVGAIKVEDLWDLPLQSKAGRVNLDDLARGLHKQLKNDDDVSFVESERKSDETIQLKFDIVKHVIDVKLAENKILAEQKDRAARKQRLMEILANKKDQSLQDMSVEDLEKELAAL
jgi:hypothetical protein